MHSQNIKYVYGYICWLILHWVMGEQLIAGLPPWPLGHEHIGRCLIG